MLAIAGDLRDSKASLCLGSEALTGMVVSQTAGERLRCRCQLRQGIMQVHATS